GARLPLEKIRMCRREHGVAERRAGSSAQTLTPIRQHQPAAARRAEEDFLEHGLAHQPENRHVVTRKPDERAPQRRAGHERARAVDRIEVPRVWGAAAALVLLLADDAVIRIALCDR